SACAADTRQAAQRERARLDTELQTARTDAGVPEGLLLPIEAQERALAASMASGSDKAYQDATTGYTRLYNQVVALGRMTPDQARTQTQTDLQELNAAIQEIQKQGFTKTATYQGRLQQAQQQFASAKTTKDYFQVDGFVQAQAAAVEQIEPVYQRMQTLNKLV